MEINLKNIEEIIFYNSEVWKIIPELSQYYSNWMMSKNVPGLRDLGKRTLLKFLQDINQESVSKLELFFKEPIMLNKINDNVVTNIETRLEDIEKHICSLERYEDMCITRKEYNVSITTWR